MPGADDRYTYPGSGGVLRNQFGLATEAEVDEAMNDFATFNWAALLREPLPAKFDLAYLRHIHRTLLGQVVGDSQVGLWAGELRLNAAPMAAIGEGTAVPYGREEYMAAGLEDCFGSLSAKNQLVGLQAAEFFEELAEFWGYLTMIHPFRDGNTRSQTAFIDRLALNAGHPIAWAGIDVDLLRHYRLAAMSNSTPLANYLSEHVVDPAGGSGAAAEDHSRIALQMILDLISQDEPDGESGEG